LFEEKHPWAKSLMVMIRNYHRRQFPRQLAGFIGRCYQVDERIERGEAHAKMVAFFDFLKMEGIRYKFEEELPARMKDRMKFSRIFHTYIVYRAKVALSPKRVDNPGELYLAQIYNTFGGETIVFCTARIFISFLGLKTIEGMSSSE